MCHSDGSKILNLDLRGLGRDRESENSARFFDIFRKLRHKIFFESVELQKNNIVIRARRVTKSVVFLTISWTLSSCHSIVLRKTDQKVYPPT